MSQAELHHLLALLKHPLGFGTSTLKHLYVKNDNNGSPWYLRDMKKDTNTPVYQDTLTGYLIGLSREQKGRDKVKLKLHLEADASYVVWSEIDTNFSKSCLLGLEQVNKEDLAEPIRLIAKCNDTSTGTYPQVFCRLVVKGKGIFHPWDKHVDTEALLVKLQQKFGFKNTEEEEPEGTSKPPVSQPATSGSSPALMQLLSHLGVVAKASNLPQNQLRPFFNWLLVIESPTENAAALARLDAGDLKSSDFDLSQLSSLLGKLGKVQNGAFHHDLAKLKLYLKLFHESAPRV
jgi:hypothetical protein